MDALEKEDIQRTNSTPSATRGAQAVGAMEAGFELKYYQLKNRYPKLKEAAIEALFRKWLRYEE